MLYNGPSATQPPKDSWRVKVWTYGMALFAAEEDGKKTRAIAGIQEQKRGFFGR